MRRDEGFTLIELLIVIAIIGVIAGAGTPTYLGIRARISLENQAEEIVSDLRWTMSRSAAQEGDSQWGVRFDNPSSGDDSYDVWRGESYASGTVVTHVDLHGSVEFSDPSTGSATDIIFSKATGLPTASSSVSLYSLVGGATGTIEVNTQGRIDLTLN